jgi:hypothetical protein
MADFSDPLAGSGASFWSLAACAAGSLLSLRTMVETAPVARAASVLGSCAAAHYLGRGAEEMWHLGPAVRDCLMFLIAFMGINILCGLSVYAQKRAQNPEEAIAWLISLWRGKP